MRTRDVTITVRCTEDEDKHYAPVDRKRLKEEWEKKESLGMKMG